MSYLIPDLPALLKTRTHRRRLRRILLIVAVIIIAVSVAYYLLSL